MVNRIGSWAIEKVRLRWRFGDAPRRGLRECSRFAQLFAGDRRSGADFFEQRGLLRFEFDKAAEDVEQIKKFAGVFREPTVGLDRAERRRRAAVADDRALAVALPIAEPLHEHLFARDFVAPHGRRDVFDVARPDEQALLRRVVRQRSS